MPLGAVPLALLLAVTSAKAPPSWETRWKKARAQTESLDFKAALKSYKTLVGEPEIPPEPRAQMLVELGVTYVNLGDDDAAGGAFARALTFNPSAALPPLSSPRVQQLFDAERDKLAPPSPPVVVPEPPKVVEPPPPADPLPVAPEVTSAPLPPTRRHLTAPVVVLGVLAAASLGTGIGLAVESQRLGTQLATPHPRDETERLLATRQRFAVGSIVGYSLSGVLAVVTAVLFIHGVEAPASLALDLGPQHVGFALSTTLP